uniref:Uncharacterized protein n=1 Tax=Aegilops tauschii TaxID=37682 RepID=N1QP38_AEGTA
MADLATAMILLVTNGGAMKGGKVDLSKMRRSMSSCLSLILQPLSSSLSAAFRRARSMPSIKALAAAGALRQWWELRLGWIMTRKPYFTRALEMSVVVAAVLECHCLSTLRHVFYKGRVDVHRENILWSLGLGAPPYLAIHLCIAIRARTFLFCFFQIRQHMNLKLLQDSKTFLLQ